MNDAVVIGGGPAGSTLATFLALAGRRVALLESEAFPRFHIGESLLPASTPILERLGVLDEARQHFIVKPGGKWLVGDGEWLGDFANCDESSSFASSPYSFMVERSKFDHLLMENAKKKGVHVIQPARVTDFLFADDRMCGVSYEQDGRSQTLNAEMVFDCSGRKALIARRFQLTRPTDIRRVALFAQYKARARDPHLQKGWFVGQMIPDGWIWLIPLEQEKISVGLVVNLRELKTAQQNPDKFFTDKIQSNPLFQDGLEVERERTSKVRLTDHMGYTTARASGKGWVLVGDAAFFVDPCYSSGVLMAMMSGELAAKAFIESSGTKSEIDAFQRYEEAIRHHEKHVSMMVQHFYNCSNSPSLQKHSTERLNLDNNRKFSTFVGGDFSMHSEFIASSLRFSQEYLGG